MFAFSLMGYEGLEVINPEGSTEDAEEEAGRGRWKQEVYDSDFTEEFSYLLLLQELEKKIQILDQSSEFICWPDFSGT